MGVKDNERARKWQKKNPDKHKEHLWRAHLKNKYNLTPDQYDQIACIQNWLCAICDKPCRKNGRLSVDHDHITGQIRGLLCDKCNVGLGRFNDSRDLLSSAVRYLDRANDRRLNHSGNF